MGKGIGKICSLLRGFVISRLFSIYFTITGVQNIVRYIEDFVIQWFAISRFHCTTKEEVSGFVSLCI